MKVYNNITEVYGNTPLVKLNKIMTNSKATVLAKLEFYNPTSTVKDRLGIAMVDAAEKSGELKPGGTIVEATSLSSLFFLKVRAYISEFSQTS